MTKKVSGVSILVVAFLVFGNLLSALDFSVTPTLVTVALPDMLIHSSDDVGFLGELRRPKLSSGVAPNSKIHEPIFSTTVQVAESIGDFKMSSNGAYAFFLMLSKPGEDRNLFRVRLSDGSTSTWTVSVDAEIEANHEGFVILDRNNNLLRSFDGAGEELPLSKTDFESFLRSRISFQPILPVSSPFLKPRFSFSFKTPLLDSAVDWNIAEAPNGWFDTPIPSTGVTSRVRSRYSSALVLSDGKYWIEQLFPNGSLITFKLALPKELENPSQLFAPLKGTCVSASGLLYTPYGSVGSEGSWYSGIAAVDLSSGKSGPVRYFRTQSAGIGYLDVLADGQLVAVAISEIHKDESELYSRRIEICVYGSESNW